MGDHRTDNNPRAGEMVRRRELDSAIIRAAIPPAQPASAAAAPTPGTIVRNESFNRYTVQLVVVGESGEDPEPIQGQQVVAVNLAEPFDRDGQLEPDTAVLVWPSQGQHLFSRPVGPAQAQGSFWARVVSGSGPSYTVRKQVASGAGSFIDAAGAEDLSAANVWELTVDSQATADVPAGAVIRVHEEPDSGGTARRFFLYPVHAVYR